MKRARAILLQFVFGWLVAVCADGCKPTPSRTYDPRPLHPGYEVWYDENRDNAWGIWDTGFYGFSEFAVELERHRIRVSAIFVPLDRLVGAVDERSAPRKLVVVNVAKYRTFTDSEVRAIASFVRRGGRLLVIGEHENMYRSADMHNALLRPYGLRLNHDNVGNPESNEHVSRSRLFGIARVYDLLSASVTVSPGVKDRSTIVLEGRQGSQWTPTGVMVRHGLGKVALLGDSEIFWNMDGRAGIDRGANRRFLRLLIARLFGLNDLRAVPDEKGDRSTPAKATSGLPLVYFDLRFGGRAPDRTPSGLGRFAHALTGAGVRVASGRRPPPGAVRILAGPLKSVPVAAKGTRLLLLGAAHDALDATSFWDQRHLQLGHKNRREVHARIGRARGFRMLDCFLTKGDKRSFFAPQVFIRVKGQGSTLPLHRAGALRLVKGSLQPWLRATGAWCERSHPGMTEKNRGVPRRGVQDVAAPLLSAYDANTLVLGDVNLLVNQRAHESHFRQLVEAILRWIRTGKPT